MAVYTNPIIDQEVSPKQLFYPDNKCAIFTCHGIPEGVILANTGSLALSDNGLVYKKTTDDVNTGWIELTSGFAASVPRAIGIDVSIVGNVGAGLDTLHTFNLPANSLVNNNDFVDYVYGGLYANTANTKRITTSFDGQLSNDSGLRTLTSGASAIFGWKILGSVIRLSATTVRINSTILADFFGVDSANTPLGFGNGGFLESKSVDLTVLNLNANPIVMNVAAEATADNDVTQRESRIWLTRF